MRPELGISPSHTAIIPDSYPAATIEEVMAGYQRIASDRERTGPLSIFPRHKMIKVENLGFIADLKYL